MEKRSGIARLRNYQGYIISAVLFAALVGASYVAYEENKVINAHLSTILDLRSENNTLKNEISLLGEALYSEQNKNAVFEEQIEEIASTVGVLDKLSKTDPELLQKYSKVYFLNEHYAPERLVTIPKTYTYPSGKELYIHAKVSNYLEEMIEEAKEDGVTLNIVSAYRSFDTQADLKSSYKVTYGAGTANQFSADQGYSEHQLGTTIDITTPEIGGLYTSFENSDAFKWLNRNAYRYGFILSYPKENSYYMYEPWHWRFVGVELARQIREDETSFYQMDQRTIDTYLVNIFD